MLNMKSSLNESSILWLVDESGPTLADCLSQDINLHPLPIPAEVGSGFIENMRLRLGMVLGRGVHHFTPKSQGKMLPFAEIEGVLSEPTLVIQSAKQGRVLLRELHVGVELLFDTNISVFQYVDNIQYVPVLDTNSSVIVSVLHVGTSAINLFIGEEYATSLLVSLKVASTPSATTNRIPAHISRILHSAFDHQMVGEMRKLYAQTKCLEYFSALIAYFENDAEDQDHNHLEQEVREIAEELKHLDGKIPALTDLADSYGISVSALNKEFKRFFNKSMYGYITDYRLSEAHAALLHSDVPMKVIADRLGYSHVNHFITAFKKKHGYTPGSLRAGSIRKGTTNRLI